MSARPASYATRDHDPLIERGKQVQELGLKIEELWEPILKTWFTEGIDDPRITVIQVTPTDGYYWDTKHNRAIVLAKMIAGAISGKTLDDSIEGKIHV